MTIQTPAFKITKQHLPRFIGICGVSQSGKSTVQNILARDFSVQPFDDGYVLREIAAKYLNATWDDVATAEGKAKLAYWGDGKPIIDRRNDVDHHMTWRQVLGNLGEQLEDLLGDFAMPMIAVNSLVYTDQSYSFGSVRRNQGVFYKAHGGFIIGVRNPLALATGNSFDEFEEDLVDFWIENDGIARGLSKDAAMADLAEKVRHAVTTWRQDYSSFKVA